MAQIEERFGASKVTKARPEEWVLRSRVHQGFRAEDAGFEV